jgi:hypothetical protein
VGGEKRRGKRVGLDLEDGGDLMREANGAPAFYVKGENKPTIDSHFDSTIRFIKCQTKRATTRNIHLDIEKRKEKQGA